MDTSGTYVRMCKQAEEIQKGWNAEGLDFVVEIPRYADNHYGHGNAVWLPRQDQLKEMIFDDRISAIVTAHELSNFARTMPKVKIGNDMKAYPKLSMEQLWLAFVMKEKYGKTWDGEAWVK